MKRLFFPIIILMFLSQWLLAGQIVTADIEEEERQVKNRSRIDPVIAQSIIFKDIKLTLGMTRADVVKSLGEQFRLVDQFEDVTLITTTNENELAVFGAARFEQERLIWLTRYWGAFFGNDVIEMATGLFKILTMHEGENGVLTTHQFIIDPSEFSYLRSDFDFGTRAITISVKNTPPFADTFSQVSIAEHLRIPELMIVGSQVLWLGISKEDVIFQLEPFFIVEEINSTTMMVVTLDESKAWILYFKDDQLIGNSSNIANIYGKGSTQLAQSIYAIIESFNKQQIFIATPVFDYADYKEQKVSRLILDFESKQIVFSIVRNSASERGILLQEQIQQK